MSERKYMFIGPPASRKSTLIRLIPRLTSRAYAIDLERVGPGREDRRRFAWLLGDVDFAVPLFLGGADAFSSPENLPAQIQYIRLLAPSIDEYLPYLAARDEAIPHKAGQNGQKYFQDIKNMPAEWFTYEFNPVATELETDEAFARHVLETLKVPFEK